MRIHTAVKLAKACWTTVVVLVILSLGLVVTNQWHPFINESLGNKLAVTIASTGGVITIIGGWAEMSKQ